MRCPILKPQNRGVIATKLKEFSLIVLLILILLVIFANALWNSDKLSTHWVILFCIWSESSPNARDRIDFPDDVALYVQLRDDWINGGVFGYSIAPAQVGGVKKFSIIE